MDRVARGRPLVVLALVRAEKTTQHQKDGEHVGDHGGGPWWSL
jgi:hypothetical protein